MPEEYIIVTGANKGIGYATVAAILAEQPDYRVILGARDPAQGQAARDSLLTGQPNWDSRLVVTELDVSSELSIAAARERFVEMAGAGKLYGLVNNAGRAMGSVAEVLDVNVAGIVRMCEAFAPLVPQGGRIVNVTSAAGPRFVSQCGDERQAFFSAGRADRGELEAFMADCVALGEHELDAYGMGGGSAYGLSKACANTLTQCLAGEWPTLTINACTPGFIDTDLGGAFLGSRSPEEAGMNSPAEGARVIMHLLFAEGLGSGHYYGSDSQRSPLDRYRAPGSPAFTG